MPEALPAATSGVEALPGWLMPVPCLLALFPPIDYMVLGVPKWLDMVRMARTSKVGNR